MKDNYQINTANKLLMIQGIDLIQNGINCIEWMNANFPNENTRDAFDMVRNRFQFLRECAFEDGTCDHLIIDKMKNHSENVQYADSMNEKVKEQLKELRVLAINERNEDKSDNI